MQLPRTRPHGNPFEQTHGLLASLFLRTSGAFAIYTAVSWLRNRICSRTHNTWLGNWQSSEYQAQPARARLSLFMLKTENLANSLLIRTRTGKIVKGALRRFDDMAPDERRALSRSLFTALDAALPFENRPSREIILSEL